MPQQIIYDVTVNGQTVPVTSDRELTEFEAYQLAKQQLQGGSSIRMGQEQYGRPVSDTGEPYQDFGTRLTDMGADMAHPQTKEDFGRLLMAGTDVTRLTGGMRAGANVGRQMLSDAARTTSGFVQPPLTGAPARILEWLANKLQSTPATTTGPMRAPAAPPTMSPTAPLAQGTSVAAEQLSASPSFRNLPTTQQVWADAPPVAPTATRVAQPLAAATEKVQAVAATMKIALAPDELDAAARLVMEGYAPESIVEAIGRQKLPAAFQGLPTNQVVEDNKMFPKMGNPKGKPAKMPTRPKGI